MYSGEDLRIEAPISRQLLESVPAVQKLICSWYPQFQQVTVTVSESSEQTHSQGPSETAVFFSGGVDSVYSSMKHQSEIDELILVHGFENPVQDEDLLEVTRRTILPTVEKLEKKLLVVRTNLRSLANPEVTIAGKGRTRPFFGFSYQGSMLGAVGLCLQHRLSRIIVPASYTYGTLEPYGSHPSLDPLWSTENL